MERITLSTVFFLHCNAKLEKAWSKKLEGKNSRQLVRQVVWLPLVISYFSCIYILANSNNFIACTLSKQIQVILNT